MHGDFAGNARRLDHLAAHAPRGVHVAVCPPYPFLAQCADRLRGSGIAVGAQDVSAHPVGAHTGEVSASMLAELDCGYVLVGHSERRIDHHETDEVIAHKVALAVGAGLRPVVCVGETLAERDGGRTASVVTGQLAGALALLPPAQLARIVVAYEPVWAIGTGQTATPEMAQTVHAMIRARLAALDPAAAAGVPILYGGSMKPANAAALLAMPDIDGGLIGSASLDAQDFIAIAQAAAGAPAPVVA
jgi:triosephosphate isomerase